MPGYLRLCCFGGKRREEPRSPANHNQTSVAVNTEQHNSAYPGTSVAVNTEQHNSAYPGTSVAVNTEQHNSAYPGTSVAVNTEQHNSAYPGTSVAVNTEQHNSAYPGNSCSDRVDTFLNSQRIFCSNCVHHSSNMPGKHEELLSSFVMIRTSNKLPIKLLHLLVAQLC